MSFTRALTLRSLLAVLFLVVAAPSAAAQDPQELFNKGMAAYQAGDYEAARTAFRQVVAAAPDHAAAMAMLGSSEDFLLELLVAGGEFETFAREILASAASATREMVRDADAAAKDAEAVFSEDLNTRNEAIFALGIKYGPFAAPPLVAALGGNDQSRRLGAIYALSRMGSSVVLPLLAATHSSNEQVRMGVLHVLNGLGDPRANARIADMAATDESGKVQALAASIMTEGGDPAEMHLVQGENYYMGTGPLALSPVENYGVLWTIEGSRLTSYDVPHAVVSLELAKHEWLRAQELGHPMANNHLAVGYAAEIAALGTGEDAAAMVAGQRNALLTIPHEAINEGLHWTVEVNQPMVAEALIRALDGPGGQAWSGFHAALAGASSNARIAAAIALAHQDVFETAVLDALAEGLGYEAIRVVHILDGDAARAATLADGLRKAGVTVTVADSGANGLANLRVAMNVDAFVVADPLPDYFAQRVITSIREVERYADTPILVIGNEETAVEGAEVVDAATAESVTAAFAELDEERVRYETVAQAAARALAHAAFDGRAASAVPALEKATGRADGIAISSLIALGYAANPSSARTLQSIVADGSRSTEVRVAAANACANLYTRSKASLDAQVFQAGVAEGDADLAGACARVLGLMGSGHLSAGVALQ
jgi:ActR/RegA family two-component response regulator